MKPGSVLLALVLGVLAIAGTVWVAKYDAAAPERPPKKEKPELLPQSGPPAKAVVDELVHDFGSMERNSKGEHVFTIRNEGEGTLLLKKGTATCKCTKFYIGDDDKAERLELAPGESSSVTVAWKVDAKTPQFHQDATVFTNDPDRRKLDFEIKGNVVYPFFVNPSRKWFAPDMLPGKPGETVGVFGTRLLQEFEITEIESTSEYVTAEATVLDQSEIERLGANAAYRIDVKIGHEIPVGRLREYLTIKGSGEGRSFSEKVEIGANRLGPIRIVGARFNPKSMTLDLGEVNIVDGKRLELSMFVSEAGEEEIQFQLRESTNPHVKLEIKPDKKFRGGSKRFLALFEIPPGELTTADPKGRAEFYVDSNHPDVKSVKFRVKYQAY